MGANMQRQAVPPLVPEAPIVGTGIEYKAAMDSGVSVLAAESGVVRFVDADKIIIMGDDGKEYSYELQKIQAQQPGHLH